MSAAMMVTCAHCCHDLDSSDAFPENGSEWADWFCLDIEACNERYIKLLEDVDAI